MEVDEIRASSGEISDEDKSDVSMTILQPLYFAFYCGRRKRGDGFSCLRNH